MVIGGYDSLEVDKAGARILGHDWRNVRHLKMIDKNRLKIHITPLNLKIYLSTFTLINIWDMIMGAIMSSEK